MTERKWTPGPWEAKFSGGETRLIAGGECTMSDTTYYPWTPENPADWHLIAAAPDLYEALEAALECGMVPNSTAINGGAPRHSRQVLVADMIRAALKKARGEA